MVLDPWHKMAIHGYGCIAFPNAAQSSFTLTRRQEYDILHAYGLLADLR